MERLEVFSSFSVFFFFFFFACECFYVTKSKPKKFKIKHLEVIWTGESLVNITRGEMVGYLLAEISNLKRQKRHFSLVNNETPLDLLK